MPQDCPRARCVCQRHGFPRCERAATAEDLQCDGCRLKCANGVKVIYDAPTGPGLPSYEELDAALEPMHLATVYNFTPKQTPVQRWPRPMDEGAAHAEEF
jgi:hypothetical protein